MPEHARPTTIRLGPFPRYLAPLGAAVLTLLVGVMMVDDCSTRQVLDCERREGRPRCELRVEGLLGARQIVYEGALLREARTAKSSSKGSSYGIWFLDQRGHERRIMSGVDRADGEQVVAFMNNPRAMAARVERPSSCAGPRASPETSG